MTTNENEDVPGGIDSDVFFWLGEDSAEELTEDDFLAKIEAIRKVEDDYLNAR